MDQPSNIENSGILKDAYDSGESALSEALKRKRKKATEDKFGPSEVEEKVE